MSKQNFQITGKVHQIGQPEIKSEKLTIRSLVLECEDGAYKQYPSFQAKNDRADLLDGYNVGQDVTVHFNITGREWQSKFFTSLELWKLAANVQAEPAPTQSQPAAYVTDDTPDATPSDLLPF